MQRHDTTVLPKLVAIALPLLLAHLPLFVTAGRTQSAGSGLCPGLTGVNVIALQKNGKILIGGDFTQIGGQPRTGIGRLNPDGSVDTSFNPTLTILRESPPPGAHLPAIAVQADDKILLGGDFESVPGQPRKGIARLNVDGTLDASFDAGVQGDVFVLALQPDGKILVGGDFLSLGGLPQKSIGRLNADGSLDTNFNPGPISDLFEVFALALQPDGKILVGGVFTELGGLPREGIGRLNPDGSLDISFNSVASGVLALALQADGEIVVGGGFMAINGQPRAGIGRLKPDGSLDQSFDLGLGIGGAFAEVVVVQADGKILVGGQFTTLGGQPRTNLARLNADGSLDTGFNPGLTNGEVFAIAVQPDGEILVGGRFTAIGGESRTGIGRLLPDGRIKSDDCPDARFNPTPDNEVFAIAVQPDDKILLGGIFSNVGGRLSKLITRLNADGSLDSGFDSGDSGFNSVDAIAVQPDGKIVVGGLFVTLAGQPRTNIGRLMADGSLDTSFDPGASAPPSKLPRVFAIAVQADGKILVGGRFEALGGQSRANIGRLNADGSLDTSFNPAVTGSEFFPPQVLAIVVQTDGKILVGGLFTGLGGQTRTHLGRLNPDGSPDATFNPEVNSEVDAIALQADGKILVGGAFKTLGGQPRSHLGRLNPDGSLDADFKPGTDASGVLTIALQADGKILIGGNFRMLGEQPRKGIGRLNSDGSLDTFDPGIGPSISPVALVDSIALQADGKILAGGLFGTIGGQPRPYFARLLNTAPALQSLAANSTGTEITWSRSGACPEVVRVTFEMSTDGLNYTLLGRGKRIQGGWKRSRLRLPKKRSFFIRARGYYAGSVVESVASLNTQ
jgi:uncharacterized delta-60 repeat protein